MDAQTPLSDLKVGGPCGSCIVRYCGMCSVLLPEEMDGLGRYAQNTTVTHGRELFFEGEAARFVYVVQSGAGVLYRLMPDGRRSVLRFLFDGDLVGFAYEMNTHYTARALDDMKLCRIPRDRFDEFLNSVPKMASRVLDITSLELAMAQDQMLLLGRKTATERLASFLLMLSRRAAGRGQSATDLGLPMGRSDIADYLGLTIETVSRTLTKLRKQGLIELRGNSGVVLLSLEELGEMAGLDEATGDRADVAR